jgi:hypothetical protein
LRKYLDQYYFDKPISYRSKILGTILVTAGIILLYNPNNLTIKLGVAFILIGIFSITLITGKSKTKTITDIQITMVISIWILLMFSLTVLAQEAGLEMFFILIFLGLLMIAELSDEFATTHLKKRMNVFIFLFLTVFMMIVAKRIISILNI